MMSRRQNQAGSHRTHQALYFYSFMYFALLGARNQSFTLGR
jgi:hypothetical protein